MATLEQLSAALIKADAAGNADDARAFAAEIRKMQTAPVEAAPAEPSTMDGIKQGAGNLLAGAVRGAGSIGATLLSPIDIAKDAINGKGLSLESNRARRKGMDDALQSMGAEPESWMYKGGKLGGEIAGTAGMGGVLANAGARVPMLAKNAAPLLDAVRTSGMSAKGMTGLSGLGTRAAGGAISGGAQAGLVNPEDAALGAGIGAALPGMLQLAQKVGGTVYQAVKGGKPGAGKMLADALGVNADELQAIIKAANNAPDELVSGSKLTLSQALQQQGANLPAVKMLDRVASQGPGGNALLNRFQSQAGARLENLRANGAVADESVRDLSTRTGDKLGAILRTQAGDERAATRAAWEALNGRAVNDGVALQIPLDELQAAMKPLGRGTVGAGADARAFLNEAQNIGTMQLPAIKAASANNSQTLEQAVRRMGGIRPRDDFAGEIRGLTNKQSGTTGLVSKMGKDVERVAEAMHERGFIPDSDPATLIDMLRGGGGRNVFAHDITDDAFRRGIDNAMGDLPAAERIAVPVPFDEFQRLRSSAGELAAKAGNAGNKTEAGVLNQIKSLLEARVNDASAGNLLTGEVMPQGFKGQYNAARDSTRQWYERYGGGNNIESILRKPVGQDYRLTGDEITNKLWHGGAGLGGDVTNLKRVLSDSNRDPAMKSLQEFIMSDAASKTKASGDLGAALPKYVESRMSGLLEAMSPDQMKSLMSVAGDIRNADAASNVAGLLGSDSYAKITRSMDAGLLDAPLAKTVSKMLSVKGIGVEPLRAKAAEMVMQHKGKTISELLANPKAAAAALADVKFVKSAGPEVVGMLRLTLARGAPLLAND